MTKAKIKIKGITGVPGPNQKSMTAVPTAISQGSPLNVPIRKNKSAHP